MVNYILFLYLLLLYHIIIIYNLSNKVKFSNEEGIVPVKVLFPNQLFNKKYH